MAGQGKLFITGFAVVGLFLFGSWSLGGTRAAERKAQAGAPDAVKVDPKHYKVELENDRVRVVRITYGPREKSVMHGHRSEEHTSELQSRLHLVCRLLLEKKKKNTKLCENKLQSRDNNRCTNNCT